MVAALRKAGANETLAPPLALKRPAAPRSARDAIAISLPLLQHADTVFLKTAGCLSCHNNSLFSDDCCGRTADGIHGRRGGGS